VAPVLGQPRLRVQRVVLTMKLKDELAELEARRVAFTSMANDPRISDMERAVWGERLDEVLAVQAVIAADMLADRAGYMAWFWADDNEPLMKKTRRFPQ
jgi:hypothetical protein